MKKISTSHNHPSIHPSMTFLLLLLLLTGLLVGRDAVATQNNKPIFLLDIDNTLYSDKLYRIEEQIRSNLFTFVENHCNMTVQEADALHKQYGSTIEGLRRTIWNDLDDTANLKLFYDTVYSNIDCSRLLDVATAQTLLTGYSDDPSSASSQLRCILQYSPHSLQIASNSPLSHVQTIWQALGLAQILPSRIRTPTNVPGFPTKVSSSSFFDHLLPNANYLLLDDSETNIRQCCSSAIPNLEGRLVQDNILEVLAVASGWVKDHYEFSDVKYLSDKNRVDERSMDVETWDRMRASIRDNNVGNELVIVDVGAGVLHMLKLLLLGSPQLEPLSSQQYPHVHYVAFEPNRNLESTCIENLISMGFQRKNTNECCDGDHTFVHSERRWTVSLKFTHFEKIKKVPHLIMGSCFADLFEPHQLTALLLKTFLCQPSDFSHTIVYFPITFAGVTSFLPPQPFQDGIPSDTLALRIYTEALKTRLGHTVDPSTIEKAMLDYGATTLHRRAARSDWIIDAQKNPILWNSMMYFLGSTAAPELTRQNWDAKRWLDRARILQPTIRVSNVDLLFRMPHLGKWQFPRPKELAHEMSLYKELVFQAPRQVKTVRKPARKVLQANQIRILTEYSLISSGTELKVFLGKFDDAALDLNIKGMDEERMAYPCSYGYSLVGRVVECGSDATAMMGKLVFTFSAHASQVVAEQSTVQVVPDGIAALDAIFMPSVETALSLVQEARPILGENVAVFGQGLIGLLVTSILRLQQPEWSGQFGVLSTFDTLDDRLMASASQGATQALLPAAASQAGPFDVAIEVSGNGRALQTAIDTTRDGGRIVVGSWYGTDAVHLKLGTDFHRSHKSLIASQVSEIPASFSKTWTKERRFGLTWELVKRIQPSSLLTKLLPLEKAQQAYEDLETGREIAVAFLYQ